MQTKKQHFEENCEPRYWKTKRRRNWTVRIGGKVIRVYGFKVENYAKINIVAKDMDMEAVVFEIEVTAL